MVLTVNVKLKGKLYIIGDDIPDDIVPKGLLKYKTDGKAKSSKSQKNRGDSPPDGTDSKEETSEDS